MISIFVRLKLRLLRNVLRTSHGLGVVAFTVLALGAGATIGLFANSTSDTDRVIFSPVFGGILVITWLVGPILFGASDETIDTTRLALYPLDGDRLATGLAVSGLIGPGPIAAAVALAGVASRAPSIPSALLAAVAIAATLTLATVNSRLLLTALGSSLRKRRTRDLATVAAGLVVGALGAASQILSATSDSINRATVATIADVVRLTPIGWSSDALGRASTGELLVPILELIATMALISLLVRLWGRVLSRALTEVTEADESNEVGTSMIRADAQPGFDNPLRVILRKERRYFSRHPRYRLQVVSQLTVLIVGGAPFLGAVVQGDKAAVLLGSIPGLTAGVTGSNLLGPDGRSLWAEVVAMPSLTPLLRGRSLAFAFLGFVGAFIITLGSAIWTGGWQYFLPALACAIGMALTGSGVGSFTSVVAPALYPDDGSPNPFATSTPGSGCFTAVFTFTGVGIGLVLIVPILIGMAGARDEAWVRLALLPFAPTYGFVIWWLTTRAAGKRANRKQPELITQLAKAA